MSNIWTFYCADGYRVAISAKLNAPEKLHLIHREVLQLAGASV